MQGEGNKQTYTTDANSNAYNVKVSGDGLVVSVWEMVLGLVSVLSGGRVTGVLGRGVLGRGRIFLRVKAGGRPTCVLRGVVGDCWSSRVLCVY